jgi:small subunit ribosomal protein S20
MAQHKSAEKRARQTKRRHARNRNAKSRMHTVVKRFQSAISAGDAETAEKELRSAESAIRKAASQGVIPWRRASRSVGRLAKRLNVLSS